MVVAPPTGMRAVSSAGFSVSFAADFTCQSSAETTMCKNWFGSPEFHPN